MTVQEAVARAKAELLRIEGIAGVSAVGNTIVVYVETEEDKAKVPGTYMGYPVVVKVIGRLRAL